MKSQRLHRVSIIIIAFLLVNVAFIFTRVVQDTVVAAASGYNNLANWERYGSLQLYRFWNPYDPTFGMVFTGLSGLVWIGMFAIAFLILFRELTGRRALRKEPALWWSGMIWGCILAGGIASYIYGPAREYHMYQPTHHFNPGTPAHFLYPFTLILFACLGLKSARERAGRGLWRASPDRNGAPASADFLGSGKKEDAG